MLVSIASTAAEKERAHIICLHGGKQMKRENHGDPASSAITRQEQVFGPASEGRSSHLPILATLSESQRVRIGELAMAAFMARKDLQQASSQHQGVPSFQQLVEGGERE